jgi:hypothetical protein
MYVATCCARLLHEPGIEKSGSLTGTLIKGHSWL